MDDDRIAIVGMAGRFPGAPSVDALWRGLCAGHDGVVRLSDDELVADGEDPSVLADPRYVRDVPILDGMDGFDRQFFGYSQREACLMDPQHRIFLEVAWDALEDAGHAVPERRQPAGVYVGLGGSVSSYLVAMLRERPDLAAATAGLEHLGNDKDFLPTRVSFKMNLDGPSLAVQTACSSSLVAVHLAAQALLAGEVDLALAGGVSVRVPHRRGYLHREGDIRSSDGRCRAFDARADGMSFGSGAAAVVLKRLHDARRDRDAIHALLLGTAVNNDGAEKLSYTAASARGQTRCIAAALAVAGVGAETLGFVEAHGTGTAMGDPVEHQALRDVFAPAGAVRGSCALGSLKTNFGHLEAAAGVAGLIKAALAVERGRIPPTLHFERANPRLHLDDGPFFVNTRAIAWPHALGPRRAGVSSLGVGGTNAFAVLEEPPARTPTRSAGAPRLVCFSAHSEPALAAMLARHADALRASDLALDDLAHTRNLRRAHLPVRQALVAASVAELEAALRAPTRPPGTAELDLAARAYEAGLDVDLAALSAPGQTVRLPGYPFQRGRFWFRGETATRSVHVHEWMPQPRPRAGRTPETLALLGGDAAAAAAAGARGIVVAEGLSPGRVATTGFILAPVRADGPEAAAARCRPLLELVATLARRPGAECAGIAVIVSADRFDAPVRGLAAVARRELPRLRVVTIEVDAGAAPAVWLEAARAELALEAPAGAVAIRGGVRHVVSRRVELVTPAPLRVEPGATYLVTGGTGALGRHFAEELARRGAGRIVLAGRRAEAPAGLAARVDDHGAELEVVACDVADAAAVSTVLRAFAPRGVVHAAGVLEPRRLVDETWEHFRAGLRAKLDGGHHLAAAAGDLDWLLLVSSIATHLPAEGQAAYAAGNAFLDALAGGRIVSVALGPTEVGMTERLPAQERARLAAVGVATLRAADAVATTLALGAARAAYGLYTVDENRQPEPGPPERREPAALAPGDLRAEVVKLLRATLDAPDDTPIEDDEPFGNYGLDSLLALDLRELICERFGLALPHSLLYDHPTLRHLCTFLASRLGLQAAPPAGLEDELDAEIRRLERVLA
jgi:acyl transferase domain-containing protein/acyl carrier protein